MSGVLAKAEARGAQPWWQRHWAWLLVGLILLFVLLVRFRVRAMPLERDEGEYAYAGQLILQGVPPYSQAYNMKLPGTYAAYAFIMAVLGQTPSAIHLGVALVNAGSIVLMFLLGRKLLDEVAGVVSALVFALMSLSPYVYGLAGHATQFVVLPALGGTLLLVKALGAGQGRKRIEDGGLRMERGSSLSSILHPRLFLLLSGLLFGLAFLMKQHGLFFGLFGLAYLLWVRLAERWSDKQSPRARRFAPSSTRHPPPSQPRSAPARLSHIAAAKLKQAQPAAAAPELEVQRSELHVQSSPPAPPPVPTPSDVSHSDAPRSTLRDLALFLAGLCLPYALTCLILAWAGVFHQFVFWTISYARQYAAVEPLLYGADFLKAGLRAVIGPDTLFWILPWFGLLVMWWEPRLGSMKAEGRMQKPDPGRLHHSSFILHPSLPAPHFFLVAFLLCSFASVSVGLYFRGHYFITLLPALALLTGVAVSRAVYLVRYDRTIELFLAPVVLLLATIGMGASLLGNSNFWFSGTPEQVVRRNYGSTIFAQTRQAAEYIKAHARAKGRVAVLGSEPEVFFYSSLRSASGYIYAYPLMEPQPFALKMQQDTIAETERAQPEFVVYVQDNFSWLRGPNSQHQLDDWWQAYSSTNLDMVLTLKIEEGPAPEDVAPSVREAPEPPRPDKYILVYHRRQPGTAAAQ